MLRILIALAAASILASPTTAQGNGCPNLRGVQKPASVDSIGVQICDGGVNGMFGAGRTTVSSTGCPLVVIVTPAHEEIAPGNGTYVKLLGTEKVVRLHFRCVTHYFLFFSIGSTCEYVREDTAGAVNHYGTFPCPVLATPEGGR
jgi:hypothetical protein